MIRDLSLRTIASIVAVALLAVTAAVLLLRGGDDTKTVTAHFPRAVSIYKGSDVRVLGVRIGTVTAVIPEGESVRVEMEYGAEHELPANAQAVIITPTLVADRFVQLTPAYTTGDVMADAAEIPLAETAVPIELDRIYASLRDLSSALGPNGVNADGTLNHLLKLSARNLEGKGALGNRMIRSLSQAAETFGQGSGDLFDTVRNLAAFTEVVADNDRLVRAFIRDLNGVAGDLAGERDELEQALVEVARTVGTVRTFVRDNREAFATDIAKLTRVIKNVASTRESLDRALKAGPIGIGNLNAAFDAHSGSIGSRIFAPANIGDADGFLCSVVMQSDLPRVSKNLACRLFERLLEPIQDKAYQNVRATPGSTASDPGAQQAAATRRQYAVDPTTSLSDLMGGR